MAIDGLAVRLAAARARCVLGREIGRRAARAVARSTTSRWQERKPRLPREATAGARLLVAAAGLAECLYEALLEQGATEPQARRLTAAVAWDFYHKAAALPWLLAAAGRRGRLGRTRRALALMMRFPYAWPGYDMRPADRGPSATGVDVYRCPVADYFAERGRLDLCQAAFCDLDYPLARRWGLRLVRPRTISRGFDHCDFCFVEAGRQHSGRGRAA
ncbi:MAG: hypothetical protein D6815_09540 [Candidatus Dadabacteria bacterium]|nr:MAG: hypothetical protein D6815_09540 [Candidatus Dadabacteria bacterium]